MTEYENQIKSEMERINKQAVSGYLSKKKISGMQPTELLMNKELIEREIEKRGIGMLFGV